MKKVNKCLLLMLVSILSRSVYGEEIDLSYKNSDDSCLWESNIFLSDEKNEHLELNGHYIKEIISDSQNLNAENSDNKISGTITGNSNEEGMDTIDTAILTIFGATLIYNHDIMYKDKWKHAKQVTISIVGGSTLFLLGFLSNRCVLSNRWGKDSEILQLIGVLGYTLEYIGAAGVGIGLATDFCYPIFSVISKDKEKRERSMVSCGIYLMGNFAIDLKEKFDKKREKQSILDEKSKIKEKVNISYIPYKKAVVFFYKF